MNGEVDYKSALDAVILKQLELKKTGASEGELITNVRKYIKIAINVLYGDSVKDQIVMASSIIVFTKHFLDAAKNDQELTKQVEGLYNKATKIVDIAAEEPEFEDSEKKIALNPNKPQ